MGERRAGDGEGTGRCVWLPRHATTRTFPCLLHPQLFSRPRTKLSPKKRDPNTKSYHRNPLKMTFICDLDMQTSSRLFSNQRNYTVSHKNAPTLASCSFDKHGLILIIFGKQHRHQVSHSLHFYLLYLFLNSCHGNDAFWRHSMLVKQSSSFSRKHRTLYLQICVRQTVRLTTEFVDWLLPRSEWLHTFCTT